MRRIALVEPIGIVAVIAVGLAALREGTYLWLQIITTATFGLLSIGLLGTLVRARPHGAWVGFALFGWGHFLLTGLPTIRNEIRPDLLTKALIDGLVHRIHREPTPPPNYYTLLQGAADGNPTAQ